MTIGLYWYSRWASTSIFMSEISDVRHRHLLFRYWKQICQTKNCHFDFRRVLISTSESILISNIQIFLYSYYSLNQSHAPWFPGKRVTTQKQCLPLNNEMSDIAYQIKVYSDILYNVGLQLSSVRCLGLRYQAQSDIADHGYRTKRPPMVLQRLCCSEQQSKH